MALAPVDEITLKVEPADFAFARASMFAGMADEPPGPEVVATPD